MDTGIEGDVAFGILASEDHEYASRFVVEDRIPLSLTLEETLQQGHLVSDRRHELEGGVEGYLKGTGDSLQQPGLGFPGRGYMPGQGLAGDPEFGAEGADLVPGLPMGAKASRSFAAVIL